METRTKEGQLQKGDVAEATSVTESEQSLLETA